MTRRKFLTLAGGGIILAATARLGVISQRYPDEAMRPWTDAGSLYTEPRKRALSFAILAPNPHNRQPWQIDLSSPDQVRLTVDTNRLLPETDPFSRQITIGQGCFLELMVMAAAADGYAVDLDLFPEGENEDALDGRPVAIATFRKDPAASADPLFAHVLQRRSLKEPFALDRPVSDATLATIAAAANAGGRVGTTSDPEQVAKLRQLSSAALLVEIETPRTFKESVDLFRIGAKEIESNPDGIDFSGPFFELAGSLKLMTREGSLDPTSSQYAQGVASVLENTDTAMAHLWLVTDGNSRSDQINAGRDWVRLNLAATGAGVGLQPLSQALQEYPEMAAHYASIHSMLAEEGQSIQMFARLGYASLPSPSPRWPLDAKLV